VDRVAGEFPAVTQDEAGRAALRSWVSDFCDTYQTHAAVIGTLSQSAEFGLQSWGTGLGRLLHLAGTMSAGMTNGNGAEGDAQRSAVACLMMLERVNYLLSSGVRLPKTELISRLTDVIFTAFQPLPRWPK
jgi:hypothetical protein